MNTNSYDQYEFHDSKLHGLAFLGEGFRSEFHLDIDTILKWPDCRGGGDCPPLFGVAKAVLKFKDVTDLAVNIDWGDSGFTTAVSGIFIDTVQKEKCATALRIPDYQRWEVRMTDGRSRVSFGASTMELKVLGETVLTERQYLLESER